MWALNRAAAETGPDPSTSDGEIASVLSCFFSGDRAPGAMKYACQDFEPIEAANIRHAARIFANRVAHQKYGPPGCCRKQHMQAHRGAHAASFEAWIGIPRPYGHKVGESYRFT